MNTTDEKQKKIDYIVWGKTFLKIAVMLILLFILVGQYIFPDERDKVSTDFQIFESEWVQILDNGDRIPMEVPGKAQAEWGDVVRIATILPENMRNGQCLCFRTIWQDVVVYVDGEVRYVYNTKESRPFGANSAQRYLFVELSEEDAGKELIYEFTSNSKYTGTMRTCYIGDLASIWIHFVGKSGGRTAIALFLLILSLFCIIVCAILQYVYKKGLPLRYLAWTIFFSAFWVLSESEFRQVVFRNVSVLTNATYWSLMIIPITMILYINEIQKGLYKKLFIFPLAYCSLNMVVSTILQILDIQQFVSILIYTHLGIAIAILAIVVTITYDIIRKKCDYVAVGIGIYGMLLAAVMEIIVYYINPGITLGSILALGLLFLLIMAIIKTGQELLQAEKKKQEAILAKDAQAKFLANMSHEIRTPINAVIGMNEMILRESQNEAVLEYAHNIESASAMLLGLVSDILDFSKIESGKLELVLNNYKLANLLRDQMLLLNARAAGKPIITHIEVDENLPSELYGDELRIKQILTNLLSNAVKYTKEGHVTLKVFMDAREEDIINVGFSVIDTGAGIKKEDLSKVFDSFKRLDLSKNRNIQGTGLGLNIAKTLVDLMKGSISVDSEYGSGSTFTVILPQKIVNGQPIGNYEEVVKQSRKSETQKIFVAPNAKVLVVDDNAMNRTLMKALLQRTQMHVDLVEGGRECLEITKENRYDIIFMDHMMPELDGIETLELLRSDMSNPNRQTKVVALTANAVVGCREMYLGYGFDEYLSKPILADEMEKLLAKLLGENNMSEGENVLLEINRDLGLSYCMNQEDFYQEMLGEFCKVAEESERKLEEAFDKKDWEQYAITAHGLKGNSLNIGAENFSALCLKHEKAAKEKQEAFLMAAFTEYVETLNALRAKIQEM